MNHLNKPIDPLAATRAIDRQVQSEWQKKHSPKAVQHFMKPAEICTLCGQAMHIDPATQEEYVISKFERKWSTHQHCFDAANDQLDRSQNIGSTRN